MRAVRFTYQVLSEVELTWPEFLALEEAAKTHYDYTCKATAKQGGLLYGWRNKFTFLQEEAAKTTEDAASLTTNWRLTSDEVDLLCKIAESPVLDTKEKHLRRALGKLLKNMSKEFLRVNALPESSSKLA